MKKTLRSLLLARGIVVVSGGVAYAANGTWQTNDANFSGYLYKGASAKTVINYWLNGYN